MKYVEPKVFLVGETQAIHDGPEGLQAYLKHIGAPDWQTDAESDAEEITEVFGRVCYKAFGTDLNPNITKVREGNHKYLQNIVSVGHGSVLEHTSVNFIFADVSRVFTHELVRHRAGCAMSQESLRFVRLDKLSAFMPDCLKDNAKGGVQIFTDTLNHLEEIQGQMADAYEIEADGVSFSDKKTLTSAFRRLAPMGLATAIAWTANIRTLRHVIEMRTSSAAEQEIRQVFLKVFELVSKRYPAFFADYEVIDGAVCTTSKKI